MISQQTIRQNKYRILFALIALLIGVRIFGVFSDDNNTIKTLRRCRDRLPYGYQSIDHVQYYSWYGKVGTSTYGYTFESGHMFSRHVAVNNRCTSEQIMNHKTVFLNQNQLQKALTEDVTMCDLTHPNKFTFDGYRNIKSPSKYIDGIDCATQTPQVFSRYFIQFKKAIQNPMPTQSQYMGSQSFTIWTFYPTR